MLVHCSYCEETSYVSAAGLQPVVSNTDAFDGIEAPMRGGFPYSFHESAKCIRDALSTWQVDIEEDDSGVETLKLTCPRHLQQLNIEELISKNMPPMEDAFTQANASELMGFLIKVEVHLKTLAQEHDRPYSYELSQTAAMLLSQLV